MLENCEPKLLWNYFERFCAIPHPSGHELKAAEFIVQCAAELGLPSVTDAVGNVLIKKDATDPAKSETIILQSHLDMVPQKNAATFHNFEKDPIRPVIIGDWVKAQGTTLGADNGIGVATALAVCASKTIHHGTIEALFTIDEERGMTGAFGLADGFLSGRKLVNLDTENEHEICIGCAGGTDVIAAMPVHTEPADQSHSAMIITISGLQGGHSGMEVHLGRAHALKLMLKVLTAASDRFGIRIADFHGGNARNAIPREAFALVTAPKHLVNIFKESIVTIEKDSADKYAATDPCLKIDITETALPAKIIAGSCMKRVFAALSECPNGVIQMCPDMPGVVQTSNNCAIIKFNGTAFTIDCMLRSSVEPELLSLKHRITSIFQNLGATITYGSIYPGWKPDTGSSLLSTMKKAYASVHNSNPEVVAVHAGLECGIIGGKFPGMEMISCGPTIHFAHSPDEQMHIPSVERFWRCLVAGLEMLK